MQEIQDYMETITGGRTVPRIFVGGKFLGGGDDVYSLHSSGKLTEILRSARAI